MVILQTEPVTERLRVREIDDDEGRRETDRAWLLVVHRPDGRDLLRQAALEFPWLPEQACHVRRVGP